MLDVWKCCAAAAVTMLLGIPGAYAADAPARMRICAMDVDYPPFGKVDGTGHLQYLTHQAAKSLGLELERRVVPRRRCLEEIKTGVSDAMATAWSPQRSEIGAFPMAGNTIDASMAMGVMTYRVYRRTGSALDWDGQRFTELGDGRLGVQAGFIYVTDRLKQLGVPYDDGAKALEPTLSKLAAGRVAGVVGMKEEADGLIARLYPGKLQRTGKVFDQTPIYLMVSHQYYKQNPKLVERFWAAMRSYRTTEDYRRYQLSHP